MFVFGLMVATIVGWNTLPHWKTRCGSEVTGQWLCLLELVSVSLIWLTLTVYS